MITDRPLIKVRRARAADADALAAVFAACWRNAYTGIIPYMHLEQLIRARDDTWWENAIKREGDILILDVSGIVAGYATFGRSRHRTKHRGEIYELYLAPVYQGIGLGEYLFEACRQSLDMQNLNGMIVWALADNQAACDFYWRRGGRAVAEVKEQFGSAKLSKIGFGWT
jgi:ribosomal protein S18 acetylase RimI-like enzyme